MIRAALIVTLTTLAAMLPVAGQADEVAGGTVPEMRDFIFRVPGNDPWSVAR